MATRIQVRRDLKANWSSSLVLASGEIAYETDTGNLKVGDGTTQWSNLDYVAIAEIATLQTDVNHADYRNQGRFHLLTTSGTWVNIPSDMTAADGDAVMLVTRHMESTTEWYLQHIAQFVTSGSETKSWERVYDSGAAAYSAWRSTSHLSPNEVVTASIANNAVTSAKLETNISIAGTLSVTGDTSLTGDLTVSGNDIKSSTATAITLSGADVSVAGDLTVTGNDIKSSSATALTLSGADVAVAGDLTVTGNDIKSSSATAMTLSGANVAVAGTLTVGTVGQSFVVKQFGDSTASGTSIEVTTIPSWARRITIGFAGLSTSGTSALIVRIGAGSFATSNYLCVANQIGTANEQFTNGFALARTNGLVAAATWGGWMIIDRIHSNGSIWAANGWLSRLDVAAIITTSGYYSAGSSMIDRVQVTTVNGTDTFDAGNVAISWE